MVKKSNWINKIRNSNETLRELLIGILFYGIVLQLSCVWFFQDKLGCSIGFWIGILTAAGAGIHMWWALDKALDYSEADAMKKIRLHSMLRYLAIVLILGILMLSGVANPLTAFAGVMSLKAAAYLQPITHKCLTKMKNKEKK